MKTLNFSQVPVLVLIRCSLLSLGLVALAAACSSAPEDALAEDATDAPASVQSRAEEAAPGAVELPAASDARQQATATDAELDPQTSADGELIDKARTCTARCSTLGPEGVTCPASISGSGRTTFLGGCRKACNFARDDAAAKLTIVNASCVINDCAETCT